MRRPVLILSVLAYALLLAGCGDKSTPAEGKEGGEAGEHAEGEKHAEGEADHAEGEGEAGGQAKDGEGTFHRMTSGSARYEVTWKPSGLRRRSASDIGARV